MSHPLSAALDALAQGRHDDPFALLGPHRSGKLRVVRAFQPGAKTITLVSTKGKSLCRAQQIHPDGIFEAALPPRVRRYLLKIDWQDGTSSTIEDPYRFSSSLGEMDRHLFAEGNHQDLYSVLGAHTQEHQGIFGTRFCVWAPNASRASVVGDFNVWDGRRHAMRRHHQSGIWEIFIPGVGDGTAYKFEIRAKNGQVLPLKTDPFGNYFEPPPGNASIVCSSDYHWQDEQFIAKNRGEPNLAAPVSIYEVHPGSWRRGENNRWLSYRELADTLIPYVQEMGFTHIELLPVTEHPFDGSWGYQPIGMFAPTQRFGTPDDLRFFIDRCHQAGIGVIVDWVPAHFPRDEHGLARFDGTALYEHEDPRKGAHADWGTLIFNYGRNEVVNYLIASALYWVEEFHIDAIRVDAVASMLYLDYSRDAGEWLPNQHGGNENLEAVAFLKKLNEVMHARGATTFAEESTAWPGVSKPTFLGGLGFTYKWNMGWMNDSLKYMAEDPIHRRYHHDKLTFGLVYAFDENFVLPLSHDEVVHGKGSLLTRMPGDDWQKFANLRAYLAFMYCHPGKKLLFMGAELAQRAEWDHDKSLDWHLLENPAHAGIQALVRDLNHLYRDTPALHDIDFSDQGFAWIDYHDNANSVFSFLRRDKQGRQVICIINMTPVVRENYRVGVPQAGSYRQIFNSDSSHYGGSNAGNVGAVNSEATAAHSHPQSLTLTLPPLAAVLLTIN